MEIKEYTIEDIRNHQIVLINYTTEYVTIFPKVKWSSFLGSIVGNQRFKDHMENYYVDWNI